MKCWYVHEWGKSGKTGNSAAAATATTETIPMTTLTPVIATTTNTLTTVTVDPLPIAYPVFQARTIRHKAKPGKTQSSFTTWTFPKSVEREEKDCSCPPSRPNILYVHTLKTTDTHPLRATQVPAVYIVTPPFEASIDLRSAVTAPLTKINEGMKASR